MKISLTRFILPVALLLLLTACDLPGGTSVPTPWPAEYLPTVVAMTAQAMATPTPTETETPTVTVSPPADTPVPTSTLVPTNTPTEASPLPAIEPTFLYFLTITPTPTPEAGRAAIYFDRPGPMSKVTSPIQIRAWVGPKIVGDTRIELIGEDGRLITRKTEKTYSEYFQWDRVAFDIPFEIRGVSELARLQVVTEAKNGRITGIGSVHVLLLSLGASEISTFSSSKEACLILSPLPDDVASRGELTITGEMLPYNTLPVIFELWDENSKVLGTRVYLFNPPDATYQKFTLTIPYNVKAQTDAYLVVRQSDDRIEGIRYLYSQPISLEP